MENRINKLLTLKNNKKYVVLNQAIYKEKNYFYVVGVTEDESDVLDEFKILEEFEKDGTTYVKTVKDQGLLELLSKYLKPRA